MLDFSETRSNAVDLMTQCKRNEKWTKAHMHCLPFHLNFRTHYYIVKPNRTILRLLR